MTSVVIFESPRKELAKPLKGGVFVLFWLIALALWIIAPNMTDPRWGAYLIDTGIVFASVGFATAAIGFVTPFRNTLLAAFLALGLFALGDFLEITAISYTLRMLVPFLALLASLYAVIGKVRVWYN